MKNLAKKSVLLLVIMSFLPGYFYSYTTTVYGMPANEYYVLTPSQQQVVRVDYEERHSGPSALAVVGAAALVGTAVYVATDHHHYHHNDVYVHTYHDGYRHHNNNIYIDNRHNNNNHYGGHYHRRGHRF